MKRLFLILSLLAAFSLAVQAQNSGIAFEQTKEWKKIVKKAKRQKKLIFVDCYTSWCGPCKMLAKKIFPMPEVGEFFNAHFINAKYDVEKEADGTALRKQYGVIAFPTMLFIDPENGNLLHRLVGYHDAQWLLDGARTALDPKANLSALSKRYEAGERTPEFLGAYVKLLKDAYIKDLICTVGDEYLMALPDEKLVTKDNWYLFQKYVTDPLSGISRKVMANPRLFESVSHMDIIQVKLNNDLELAVNELVKSAAGQNFDQARFDEFVKYLLNIDFYSAPSALAYLYTLDCSRKGDYAGVVGRMREAIAYNVFRDSEDLKYFDTFVPVILKSGEKALLADVLCLLDTRYGNLDTMSPYLSCRVQGLKVSLLKGLDRPADLQKAQVLLEKYQKLNEEDRKRQQVYFERMRAPRRLNK